MIAARHSLEDCFIPGLSNCDNLTVLSRSDLETLIVNWCEVVNNVISLADRFHPISLVIEIYQDCLLLVSLTSFASLVPRLVLPLAISEVS